MNCFERKHLNYGKTCVSSKTVIISYVWPGNLGQRKRFWQCISLLAGSGWSKIQSINQTVRSNYPCTTKCVIIPQVYDIAILSAIQPGVHCGPTRTKCAAISSICLYFAAVWYEGWFVFALNINEWFRMVFGLLSQPTNWSLIRMQNHSHWFIYTVS